MLVRDTPLPAAVHFARLQSKFEISADELAKVAGVDRVALSAGNSSVGAEHSLTEFEIVIDRLIDWAGGAREAIDWYRSHRIPAFGGETAEVLVKSGGARFLNDYLDSIAVGGFA